MILLSDTVRKGMHAKEEVIESIKAKAKSYVPEWRFDEENPDVGTALALVYADMFSKTVKKFGRVMNKNNIAFLNELNAQLKPAEPAEGYVSFGLVASDAASVQLPAGTIVTAQSQDAEIGTIHYRTTDDVLVSPAQVSVIYQTEDAKDRIFRLFDRDDETTAAQRTEGALLFADMGENLQKHELYIGHSAALNITGAAQLCLSFYRRDGVPCAEESLAALCDPAAAVIEYDTAEGYQCFSHVALRDGLIYLTKPENSPPLAVAEVGACKGHCIRIRTIDVAQIENFSFRSLGLRCRAENIAPDGVIANGIESTHEYFPFGERISPFNEVYFASEEVLCKKGAHIKLSFNTAFRKIPLDFDNEENDVNWEWIMKRDSFRLNPKYDVTISEVLWEYYNGIGWARLYPDATGSGIFTPPEITAGQHNTIEFVCPQDMEPFTVGSRSSYFIRARITKVDNAFKLQGAYISPLLSNTSWSYDYAGCEVTPEFVVTAGNLDMRREQLTGSSLIAPFGRTGYAGKALYLGFDLAPEDGPLKLLFEFKNSREDTLRELLWEWFDGKKWCDLNVIDETRSFSHTGIVTMLGGEFSGKTQLFGREKYWLRIKETVAQKGDTAPPHLLAIHENTTKVINSDSAEEIHFRMEAYQENMKLELPSRRIIEAEVYVNEYADLSETEVKHLLAEERAIVEYDEAGVLEKVWVRWSEVDFFPEAGASAGVYVLDRNSGTVMFGNGRNGRIPSASKTENIRILYQSGGGSHTNVKKGEIDRMERYIGFVSSVKNPLPLSGGCDIEPIQDAIVRSSAMIRHQNRAVTTRDYEELAKHATRGIARVKCFSGIDGSGARAVGSVALVVLLEEISLGNTHFNAVKKEIEEYLLPRISGELAGEGRLFVVEPSFVEISVRAELEVGELNHVFAVKNAAMERLERYLNPLKGGAQGDGWEIGRIPNMLQIKNVISAVPKLHRMRNIYISAYMAGEMGRREVDLESVTKNRLVLPMSGRHNVHIDVK